MTTSNRLAPLLARVARVRERADHVGRLLTDQWFALRLRWHAARGRRGLPPLLSDLGTRFAPLALRRGVTLELDIDACLDPDLDIPAEALRRVLTRLLERALRETEASHVALRVDVVGGDDLSQVLHLTVADSVGAADRPAAAAAPSAIPARDVVDEVGTDVAALDGSLQVESGDGETRLIVELALPIVPCALPIDVDALRTALGGEAALRAVVEVLDRTLVADLARLDAVMANADDTELAAWLHRVSGALGMAEASDLARVGVDLEQAVSHRRTPSVDEGVRRFARRTAAMLDALRAARAIDEADNDHGL